MCPARISGLADSVLLMLTLSVIIEGNVKNLNWKYIFLGTASRDEVYGALKQRNLNVRVLAFNVSAASISRDSLSLAIDVVVTYAVGCCSNSPCPILMKLIWSVKGKSVVLRRLTLFRPT